LSISSDKSVFMHKKDAIISRLKMRWRQKYKYS
jgi:hypothetical protein